MPFYVCPRKDSSATLRPGHHGAGSLAKPGHPCPAAVERELCAALYHGDMETHASRMRDTAATGQRHQLPQPARY